MPDDPGQGAAKSEGGAAPAEAGIAPPSAAGETATASPDVAQLVDQLLRQSQAAAAQPKDIWYFLSSGFFFMLVGAIALFAAFNTMGTTHASFTFVLVVVGVAILLYGTGTQGAGNFESSAGELKYKIGVAGGAGILAFAVGIGIVEKSADIKDAFQIEKKYARLIFRDQGDGVGNLADYIPEITVDGVPVPSQRNGEYIVAYVPFSASPGARDILISANFYYAGDAESRNKLLSQKVTLRQNLPLGAGEITTDDAGFDFPRLKSEVMVKLVGDLVANDPDRSQRDAVGASGALESAPPPVPTSFE